MALDLDTFVTAVYDTVDALYQEQFAPQKPRRPGPRPRYSDSEVLTLALLAQYRPDRSERACLRYAATHWGAYFPQLPCQSTFNRRVRDLEGVLSALGPLVAQQVLAQHAPAAGRYEVLDATPVPLLRRCRGNRHKCFGDEAAIGRGGSDRDWFYGMDLEAAISASGAITGAVLAPADTEERFSAETLLCWRVDPTRPAPTAAELDPLLGPPAPRVGPTGPLTSPTSAGPPHPGVYLADRGLAGQAWHQHWQDAWGATVFTAAELPQPGPGDATGRHQRRILTRWFSGLRQVVETTFGHLQTVFGLAFPRARTYQGVRTRVAAKIAAFNLALLLNHHAGRPRFAFFNPFDA
jgi:hypothetical protein